MKRTNQQIFDTIWVHLNEQGKAAVNDEGSCAYNGENGTMCAVGCLLSPEALANCPENISVQGALDESMRNFDRAKSDRLLAALESSGIDTNDKAQTDLLIEMQQLHDTYLADTYEEYKGKLLTRWRQKMAEYAHKNGLMPRPVDFQIN